MYYIHTGQAPQYLSNCVSTISSSGNRYRLRSCDTVDYILPRTRTKFGDRGLHYSGPAAWNTLPSDLYDITNTNAFKKRLKTVLFHHHHHHQYHRFMKNTCQTHVLT